MNRKTKRLRRGELRLFCALGVVAALLLSSRGAGAQSPPRSFSADMIQKTDGRVTNGKIYSSDEAVRPEKTERGKQTITIMRLDLKVVWVLMPAQKTYMDMGGLGAGSMELATSTPGAKVERRLLGSEQVGAYHCDKFRVQATFQGRVYTSLEWDAEELGGFPVKQAGEKGEWSKEYENVHLGPQDPSLFEIPAGYKKLNLGGMFKPRT